MSKQKNAQIIIPSLPIEASWPDVLPFVAKTDAAFSLLPLQQNTRQKVAGPSNVPWGAGHGPCERKLSTNGLHVCGGSKLWEQVGAALVKTKSAALQFDESNRQQQPLVWHTVMAALRKSTERIMLSRL
jgi:hypothetical protein